MIPPSELTRMRTPAWAPPLLAMCLASSAAAQCSYTLRLLDEPPHPQCPTSPPAEGAKAINNRGECAGESLICAGVIKPCRWDVDGTWHAVPVPGMTSGSANSIGDDGTIIGTAEIGGIERWFRSLNGQVTLTPPPCTSLQYAKGVAYIAGGASAGSIYCADGRTYVHAYILSGSNEWTDIGLDIAPDHTTLVTDASPTGFVVGRAVMGFGGVDTRAFRWQGGSSELLPPVPGGYTSMAVGTNSWGDVVGNGLYDLPNWPRGDPSKGFLYIDGVMYDAGFLPGKNATFVYDINDLGQAVGQSGDWYIITGTYDAVLWQHGTMHKVLDLVVDPVLQVLPNIDAVNDRGEMIATSQYQGTFRTFVLSPIRERDGDVDLDCAVNMHDLNLVLRTWSATYDYDHGPGDANNDHVVDAADLATVLGDWDAR